MRSPHRRKATITTPLLINLIIATLIILSFLPAPAAAATRTRAPTPERTKDLHLVFRRGEHDSEEAIVQAENHYGGGEEQQQQPIMNTPAPGQDEMLASKGYAQTTYYKCQTAKDGSESCGWHVPVVKATASKAFSTGAVVAAVMAAAVVFALGLG